MEKRFVEPNPMYVRDGNGELVALPQATIPFHIAHGHVVSWHYYGLTFISGPPNESDRLSQLLEKFSNSRFKTRIKSTCPALNSPPRVARNPFRGDISSSTRLCVIFPCLQSIAPYMLLS